MSMERAQSKQGKEQVESRGGQPAQGSSKLLKSGVDAREAARLSAEVHRAKARRRERDAEIDRLTVAQRLATGVAATG